MKKSDLTKELKRIADALEALAPPPAKTPDFGKALGYLWAGESKTFTPVEQMNAIDLSFLVGLDLQVQKLITNTKAFQKGYPANNALLWGARGMGKSSLIKAVHKKLNEETPKQPLIIIEILREDIATLGDCLAVLKNQKHRFILFCDDLSFEQSDEQYKTLKAMLEGGITGRPGNVIFYATSNQRHLMRRGQSEYEKSTAINENDITNETISLSDRFGLWLGFHNGSPEEFREMVRRYAAYYKIPLREDELQKQAHQWAMERGARSGRVAFQFIQHLLGVYQLTAGKM